MMMAQNNNFSDTAEAGVDQAAGLDTISIVQRGNLKTLEKTLRKQWRLGQNIVLCWSSDERGLLVILVPHYYLGNYCATGDTPGAQDADNETFVRELISGQRRKTRDELFAVSERLDVPPTFIKLNTALTEEPLVLQAVEQLIKRYGLSYVDSRAVLLFDIVEFSLYTPFEQASQLNSLSYSLNSAYNKLQAQGIEINFARTTTGDGYYIWNRDLGPGANRDLFYFMVLVVADNRVARAASRGNTVPVVRAAYHIGGHYELYQAEGVNPSVFSYIVGDVTIELARMVDLAQANQILIGDFQFDQPGRGVSDLKSVAAMATPAFISFCNRELAAMRGIQLSGKAINTLSCYLTQHNDAEDKPVPRRFRIVDKHGLSRHAYNLQIDVELDDRELALGLGPDDLPQRGAAASAPDVPERETADAPSAEELFDDLASLLKKRSVKTITED
ncbi:MAG: hypothetical protein OEV47_19465 [Gammaproteobacteria bacterium]|jgi:hypothetical protein|nr:hypothetical protein [Gammaproteobacteria bacterium]